MSFRLGLVAILCIVRSVPPLMGEKSAYLEERTEGGREGGRGGGDGFGTCEIRWCTWAEKLDSFISRNCGNLFFFLVLSCDLSRPEINTEIEKQE